MLAGYFNSLPKGLEEAAGIDGASPLGTLIRIIIPLSLPGIVAIFSFMTAWNELLFASLLTTESTRTLAVGLQGYATQSNVILEPVDGGLYRGEHTHRDRLP